MKTSKKISVCIAAYNGERYIHEQVMSILAQLSEFDELLINDDKSSDSTVEVISRINDARVKLHVNKENNGYVKNFEACIGRSDGDYIFLADQDDIWPVDRVKIMINACLDSKKNIIFGGYKKFTDSKSINLGDNLIVLPKAGSDEKIFKNIILFFKGGELPLFGSCMMLRKKALPYIMPFPSINVSHDHWLAVSSILRKDIHFLSEIVTLRRIHYFNLTNPQRLIILKIWDRLKWIYIIFLSIFRKFKSNE